jgi:hypothetical protein
MKPVDRFSELLLLTAISFVIVIVVMLIGLFGYILVRNIIEKNKNKKEK